MPAPLIGRLLAVLALAGLAACAGSEPVCGQPEAHLPITMRRNIPVVPVTVDQAPAELILDTGAEHTVLLAAFVDRIRLKRDFQHVMTIRGIGGAMETAMARPEEIGLGGVTVARPYVIVSSFSTGDLPGGVPDGLLGADILARFDLDIDLPRGALTLYPACRNATPQWKETYVALPARLQRGRFIVPVTLDGVAIPIALDTGAEYSLISARAATAAGAGPAVLARDPPTRLAVVGPDQLTAHVHRFGVLQLGAEQYPNPMLPVVSLSQGTMEGLLGMNYLRHHRVWLSYASGRVFVSGARSSAQ